MSEKPQPQSYPLRMPAELRERVEQAAFTNKRSLNAEILERLEESLMREQVPAGSVGEKKIIARLNELMDEFNKLKEQMEKP